MPTNLKFRALKVKRPGDKAITFMFISLIPRPFYFYVSVELDFYLARCHYYDEMFAKSLCIILEVVTVEPDQQPQVGDPPPEGQTPQTLPTELDYLD